jgi:hypothetical protein
MSRLLSALVLLIAFGFAPLARASCIKRSSCFCISTAGADAVAQGPVETLTGAVAVIRVEAITGTSPGASVGDTLTISTFPQGTKVGDKLLASRVDDVWHGLSLIGASNTVTCSSLPDERFNASDVTQLTMRPSCDADFETLVASHGIKPQECHDTGCQQAGPSVLALLVVAALRRRRITIV